MYTANDGAGDGMDGEKESGWDQTQTEQMELENIDKALRLVAEAKSNPGMLNELEILLTDMREHQESEIKELQGEGEVEGEDSGEESSEPTDGPGMLKKVMIRIQQNRDKAEPSMGGSY